jgi:hypothetical protein
MLKKVKKRLLTATPAGVFDRMFPGVHDLLSSSNVLLARGSELGHQQPVRPYCFGPDRPMNKVSYLAPVQEAPHDHY